MRFFLIVLALLCSLPALAEEKFQDTMCKSGIELGSKYGIDYGKVMFSTKVADITLKVNDDVEEPEEARLLFRFFPIVPTGHEKFSMGLDVRSYPEPFFAVDRSTQSRDAKIALTLAYKVTRYGNAYLDIPVASRAGGVPWFLRVVVEDLGASIARNIYLTTDMILDQDPSVGYKGSLNIMWVTDSFKIKVGTSGAAIAFGSGFNF